MEKKFTIYLIGFETGLPHYVGYQDTFEQAEIYAKERINSSFQSFEIKEQIMAIH